MFVSGLIGYSKYIIVILNPSSSVEPRREISFKKKKINYIYHGLVTPANKFTAQFHSQCCAESQASLSVRDWCDLGGLAFLHLSGRSQPVSDRSLTFQKLCWHKHFHARALGLCRWVRQGRLAPGSSGRAAPGGGRSPGTSFLAAVLQAVRGQVERLPTCESRGWCQILTV